MGWVESPRSLDRLGAGTISWPPSREGGTSILDNLLLRMEQYANNLEKLVEGAHTGLPGGETQGEVLYQFYPSETSDTFLNFPFVSALSLSTSSSS